MLGTFFSCHSRTLQIPTPEMQKRNSLVSMHTAPASPVCTHDSGKLGTHTVPSASDTAEIGSYTLPSALSSAEIVDGGGLCAHGLHINTVVAQRMTDLHSSLELLK